MPFAGFPRRVRFTPVPVPLLGPLLEEIDDLAELKCTLRLVWLLHQKRGFPRHVTFEELAADPVLVRALGSGGRDSRSEVSRALRLAVKRGTVLEGSVGGGGRTERLFVLNTEVDRKALAEIVGTGTSVELPGPRPWDGAVERPNIFGLYEDNIGMLNPMIAEELKEAEDTYPQVWIEDAFREAVKSNKRSWRYIAAILERWEREGKGDGRPVGSPEKAGYERYLGR